MHEPLSAMGPPHNAMNLQLLGSKFYDYFTGLDARWLRWLAVWRTEEPPLLPAAF